MILLFSLDWIELKIVVKLGLLLTLHVTEQPKPNMKTAQFQKKLMQNFKIVTLHKNLLNFLFLYPDFHFFLKLRVVPENWV